MHWYVHSHLNFTACLSIWACHPSSTCCRPRSSPGTVSGSCLDGGVALLNLESCGGTTTSLHSPPVLVRKTTSDSTSHLRPPPGALGGVPWRMCQGKDWTGSANLSDLPSLTTVGGADNPHGAAALWLRGAAAQWRGRSYPCRRHGRNPKGTRALHEVSLGGWRRQSKRTLSLSDTRRNNDARTSDPVIHFKLHRAVCRAGKIEADCT